MKILIAGDFAPVYHRLKKEVDLGHYADILGEVRPIVEKADFSIVNFECPIVGDNGVSPIKKHGPNISCSSNGLAAVKWAGFDMITLANNHVLDFGEQCLIGTINAANSLGISTVGAGANLSEAAKVKYVNIDNKVVAIINCCENEFSIASDNRAGANPINPIKQYYSILEAKSKSDYVIVITHGGHEYFQLPSERMQDTYRFYIDSGADAVINHHQHCYSGFEVYNGKPIFYGLGNFCFDKANHFAKDVWTVGFLVELIFTASGTSFELIPYTQCDDKPVVTIMKDRTGFEKKICELNEIISNRSLLKKHLEAYYSSCSKSKLNILEPYRGKYLSAALHRGLVPRFITGSKIQAILNMVNCESHRDILQYALKHKI